MARRLLARGVRPIATTRLPEKLQDLAAAGAEIVRMDVLDPGSMESLQRRLPSGLRVLHSIPVIAGGQRPFDPTPQLLDLVEAPARVVYLSTTGVYGPVFDVDEQTAPAPEGEFGRLRVAAESAVLGGSWPALVLRSGAIYGPGRGVHESIRSGQFRLVGDGANWVSRIHVNDLAALAETALFASLTGAYPVADREPSTSREMAQFCADLLGLPFPPSTPPGAVHRTRSTNRRVDGTAIFDLLDVPIQYASFRDGVPAALAETAR